MTSDIAISVRGLGKSYTIAHNQERHITLAETMLHRLRRPFHRPEKETFHGLKDVAFDIKKGDLVRNLGQNDARESTLLNIFAPSHPKSESASSSTAFVSSSERS